MKLTVTLAPLATLFWVIAFFCSFSWVSAFEIEFLIATLTALFAASILGDAESIPARVWTVPVTPVVGCGLALWLLALLSVATSDILFVSWINFFYFSLLPLTVVFFLVARDSEDRFALAWQGVRIVLALLSGYVLFQYFQMPQTLINGGRAHEPFRDPNSLAALLSLGMVLVSGRILRYRDRMRMLDGILLLLLVGAFWAANSRGAVLSLMIMTPIFIALVGPKTISRRSWLFFAGAVVLSLLLVGVMRLENGPFRVFGSNIGAALGHALADRLAMWAGALKVVADHPVLGTGIGTFEYYYAAVRAPGDTTYGYMAHNEPLQFAAEMGILAAAAFYGAVACGIWRTWKALKRIPRGDERRLDILIPFTALGALVLHSHLTFNFHIQPVLLLSGFAFALWHYHTGLVLRDRLRVVGAPRWLGKDALEGLFLVVAFIAIVAVAGPLYSQRLVEDAAQDLREGRLEDFAHKVNLSDTLSMGSNAQAYALAAKIPLGFLQQTVKPVTPEDRDKFLADAQRLLDGGRRANPMNPDLIVQLAELAELRGDETQADALLREALRVDPLTLSARMRLGDRLAAQGHLSEAVTLLSEGLDYYYGPERAQSYMQYFIQTMALQEKLEKAGKGGAGR